MYIPSSERERAQKKGGMFEHQNDLAVLKTHFVCLQNLWGYCKPSTIRKGFQFTWQKLSFDIAICKICLGELPSGFGTCPLQLQVHKPHGFADLSWNFVTKCCKFPVKQLLSALPTRTNSSASTKKNVITLLSGTAFFNQVHISSSSSSSSPFLTQESSAREGFRSSCSDSNPKPSPPQFQLKKIQS